MRLRLGLRCLFLGFTLIMTSSETHLAAADTSVRAPHSIAPGFALRDATGAIVRLSDYRGKVVLLDFWATTCGGCKVEIPWFMEFKNRYKNSGLVIIGAALDDDGWKSVKPFVEEKKMNYPVVVGNGDLIQRYGIEAMPTTLLIDRDGKIVSSHVGLVDKGAFENEIRTLLRQ